jgi:LEA14-like dessication related protein
VKIFANIPSPCPRPEFQLVPYLSGKKESSGADTFIFPVNRLHTIKTSTCTRPGLALMKTKMYYILAALVLPPFYSCQNVLNLLQQTSLKNPTVSVLNTEITGLSFSQIDLQFDFNVHNPNSIAVKLQGMDYQLRVNENSFLSGDQVQGIDINANSDNKVTLPLTLKFVDLYQTVSSLLSQDTSVYQLNCGLTFDVPVLGTVRIPVAKAGSLPLLKLPHVRLEGIRLNNLNLLGANLEIKLNIENTNGFALLLNQLNYNLNVNGVNWVQGQAPAGFTLDEKGNRIVSIPLALNFTQIGSSVYQLLSGNQDITYRLSGDANLTVPKSIIQTSSFVFDQNGQVKLKK